MAMTDKESPRTSSPDARKRQSRASPETEALQGDQELLRETEERTWDMADRPKSEQP